jgi:hypothetical protein
MRKSATLLLIAALVLSSLITIGSAQSIPKPSVPEFAIETVSFPYDVPPSTTTIIDEYTGEETVVTHPGYHVENKTTQIKITNQAFSPYQIQKDGVTWTISLFYDIRWKGHYSDGWIYYYRHNGSSDGNLAQHYDAEYTIVPIDSYLPSEGEVDFQIQALIGYEQGIVAYPGLPGTQRVITGESSDWSEIQTLTIKATLTPSPETTPTPPSSPDPTSTSSPYQEPQIDQQLILSAAVITAASAFGLTLLYRIKRK